jgi:DNA-binding response OmpR family regulator
MDVLIVDDEADICRLITRILEQVGMQCDMATNFRNAYQKATDSVYDMYILDINLRDGTGFDLIPMIRQQAPEAMVVIISAHDDPENQDKAVIMGANTFIRKPFTKSDILSLLSN